MSGVGVDGRSISLTDEQQRVIDLALPKAEVARRGAHLIRITSAAGTGKTTTLEALARRYQELGHSDIVYLTFNKTAVADATLRLGSGVRCRTLHSQAMSCLSKPESLTMLDDSALDALVAKEFKASVNRFLQRMPARFEGERKKKTLVHKKVCTFIRKTLERFLHSKETLDEGFDHTRWNTTYYPAKRYHQYKAQEDGAPTSYGDFYCVNAKKLYDMLRPKDGEAGGGKVTYDTMMKECQLQDRQLPYSVILVDESQDCNECQIDWLYNNREGRTVVFVGDSVQTIYGFRGAKSKYLTDMDGCVDAKLTTSFRFGPQIGCVANILLYAKQHSPQANTWTHYRLTGGSPHEGVLVNGELYAMEDRPQITILAHGNMTLLKRALMLRVQSDKFTFALNGVGDNSGRKKWMSTIRLLTTCYELFSGKITNLKNKGKDFAPFADVPILTWKEFKKAVEDQELSKFDMIVALINEVGSIAPD